MAVAPHEVPDVLARHLCYAGFDLVLDLDRSRGSRLVDARSGEMYLDLFTFFASSPLGWNPPQLTADAAFLDRLTAAALNKVANGDVATVALAEFVETFERVMGVADLPRLFLISGGALAVENALKAAFDAAGRRNEQAGRDPRLGSRVLHLRRAFHGRSGYTMSLTNTDPRKVAGFPTFDWPRIDVPDVRFPVAEHLGDIITVERRALRQAAEAFERHRHDIACAIVEPIQCEGGDNHLRAEFLQSLQALCHEHDALFVVDEVQTGMGVTGTPWCHQQLGLEPDLVAFGKKAHVCGVMGGRRLDEVQPNVFTEPGRIDSTWNGSLVDMVRATRILEVIEQEGLMRRATELGAHLLAGLARLAADHGGLVDNVRGRGLLCAFDLPDTATRDALLADLVGRERVLLLGAGSRSVRFRPHLAVTSDDLDLGLAAVHRALSRVPVGDRRPDVRTTP